MIDLIKQWFSNSKNQKQFVVGAQPTPSNKYYMDKYNDFDKIIATKYQQKDATGKLVDVDGVVSPIKIDNRQLCSVTDQQGSTPHCAGYSICNIAEALIWKKTGKLINLNADQVYAKAKQLDKQADSNGTYLEYAIKAAVELGGFGSQSNSINVSFLYNNNETSLEQKIKRLVHKHDFVHAGFAIDDGWYKATDEDCIIKKGSQQLGGHAVLICGYDSTGVYIQNSWGKSWGSKGFAILPWSLVKQQLIYCCVIENFNI